MRHIPTYPRLHREDDAGPSAHKPDNGPSDASSSTPAHLPQYSIRPRSKHFLQRRIHYSSGPVILLWDEIDDNVPAPHSGNVYENDVDPLDTDSSSRDV